MELSAVDFIKTLGVSFAALFPIVNPLGDAPIFFGLTQNYPQSAQKLLSRKIAAYGFVLLVVSALFGSEILAFFGISLFVVQIAGGLSWPRPAGSSSISQMTILPQSKSPEHSRMLLSMPSFR